MKPALMKKKTERIIIHCGTNDLASEKAPEESIAESIINLTESAKSDKLNEKARKVNVQMKKLLQREQNSPYWSHQYQLKPSYLRRCNLKATVNLKQSDGGNDKVSFCSSQEKIGRQILFKIKPRTLIVIVSLTFQT